MPIIKSTVNYLWVLGPPANLLYQTNYLWAYVAGTAGFFPLFAAGLRIQQSAIAVVLLLLSAMAWGLSGMLIYAPAI